MTYSICSWYLQHVQAQGRAAIDSLKELGLTEYEARVYICALTEGSLPMRELAFRSGVPRTKVYQSVRSLAKRGLLRLKEKPLRFTAVDADEVFDSTIRQEEKRLKELKASLARIRRLREEGLKGKSIAEGKYYIYVASEAQARLSDMIEDCQSSFHAVVDSYWMNVLISCCRKQLASLSLRDVDVKIVVMNQGFEEVAEQARPDIASEVRVLIGKANEGRSIFIADGSSVMIANPSSGGATIISLGDVASMVERDYFQQLWNDSVEMNRYMRMKSSGLAEELESLSTSRVEKLLLDTLFSRMKNEDLEAISTDFYLRLASAVPSRIFTLKPEAGLHAWTELLDHFLAERGKVRYDDVTKLISIELRERTDRLPSNPWMVAFLGYLRYNGIPLRLINRVDSEEGTIFQGKISWNILA
ncbi:MAG: helix-turn-helix domain-containing protein [Conexivisphaerales archaeon]